VAQASSLVHFAEIRVSEDACSTKKHHLRIVSIDAIRNLSEIGCQSSVESLVVIDQLIGCQRT
jgi:hypothetical protein